MKRIEIGKEETTLIDGAGEAIDQTVAIDSPVGVSPSGFAASYIAHLVHIEPEDEDRCPGNLEVEERLRAVPGVQVDNRYNYALGERISIRGFGARAQFGVRGPCHLLPLARPAQEVGAGHEAVE